MYYLHRITPSESKLVGLVEMWHLLKSIFALLTLRTLIVINRLRVCLFAWCFLIQFSIFVIRCTPVWHRLQGNQKWVTYSFVSMNIDSVLFRTWNYDISSFTREAFSLWHKRKLFQVPLPCLELYNRIVRYNGNCPPLVLFLIHLIWLFLFVSRVPCFLLNE